MIGRGPGAGAPCAAWEQRLTLPTTHPDGAPAGKTGIALRAVELLLVAACLLPMIFLPLTRDQATYAYAGQVILDGELPYRDVFACKGPAIHYTYAAAMWLFGQTEIGVRLFFYLVALGGSQLAAGLGARLGGRWARLPCALCYALAALQGNSDCAWFTAETEDLTLLLTLGVILLIGTPRYLQCWWRLLLAGMLLALACLFKPTALPVCVVAGAVAMWELSRKSGCGIGAAATLRKSAWAVAGFLIPAGLFALWLLVTGLWADLWQLVVEFNVRYSGIRLARDFTDQIKALLNVRWRGLAILVIVGLVAGKRHNRVTWRLLWAALIGGWLAVIWQGKYFAYHWTPVVGCMAILAGCECGRLGRSAWRRFSGRGVRVGGVLAAVILLPSIAAPANVYYLNRLYRSTFAVLAGHQTADELRAPFQVGGATADVTRKVAVYVREHSQPGDTVVVWGYDPAINFLADRRSPTRFVLRYPLTAAGPLRDGWRKEFLRDVADRKPLYVVVVERDSEFYAGFDPVASDVRLREFVAFHEYLLHHYVEETRIERFVIHRRR